uniref:Uncharacterized protein n=1 Tax=Micrurus spixii TaxID=129469 RepID=A0A2D4LTN9_9SAUR
MVVLLTYSTYIHIYSLTQIYLNTSRWGIFIASAVDIKSQVPKRRPNKRKKCKQLEIRATTCLKPHSFFYTIWAGNSEQFPEMNTKLGSGKIQHGNLCGIKSIIDWREGREASVQLPFLLKKFAPVESAGCHISEKRVEAHWVVLGCKHLVN